MTRHVLVVRLDSAGDMLVCGPAIRAVAAAADRVTVLASPLGAEAAALLPGVDDVVVFDCPWITAGAPAVDPAAIWTIVRDLAGRAVDEAVILTSFHQNALPTALLLRLAGVPTVAAVSEDYPGSLLDVRVPAPPDAAEPVRMAAIAAGAGYPLAAGDDGRLAVRTDRLGVAPVEPPYVVVHPGASAPARSYPAAAHREVVAQLVAAGYLVVVTGGPGEQDLTAQVASGGPGERVTDLGGRLDLAGLGAVLTAADVVVVGNTGPAHVAAAVGTPVVSLFSPVVPALRWAPYGVPTVLLGDQAAACRGTRARECPVAGHPCLAAVTPAEVVAAVALLRAPVERVAL